MCTVLRELFMYYVLASTCTVTNVAPLHQSGHHGSLIMYIIYMNYAREGNTYNSEVETEKSFSVFAVLSIIARMNALEEGVKSFPDVFAVCHRQQINVFKRERSNATYVVCFCPGIF